MSNKVTEWSPRQQRFIAWLALPEELRDPRFQQDLAGELGVKRETLSRWKRIPGLTAEAARFARELLKDELPAIFGTLVKEAKSGSFQHIKLVLEVAGEYEESLNLNHNDKNTSPTAREIREIDSHIGELEAEIAALEAAEGGASEGESQSRL